MYNLRTLIDRYQSDQMDYDEFIEFFQEMYDNYPNVVGRLSLDYQETLYELISLGEITV